MIAILFIFVPVAIISFGLAAAPALLHLKQQMALEREAQISTQDFSVLEDEIAASQLSV